ncbi:MAG: PIN domain-containing protein [Intrasporangium sp.]|uniref:PIN domain-containing protein n=1 Tax=Intrasporangium sp. TaxID=1925024 RepID=UPI002647BBB5|nr:PIN domain-containing protein [Intrasporangium sp.]MDN5798175.1 PIN domain-containing protein [Intrasporangium sp.]
MADTSVWISAELGRQLDRVGLPDVLRVSVITLAELQAGVLAAADPRTASTRLRTLQLSQESEPLPVDAAVAQEWALLRVEVTRAGRRVNVNDLWIGATARANRLPVVTQDGDFDVLAMLGLIDLVQV